MCQWTRARPGTWLSCPLLVTSSFTPSCQLTRTWSSCTWTSPKVGPRRSNNLNKLPTKPTLSLPPHPPTHTPPPHAFHFALTSFVCVLFFADTGFGTIYASDDRGIVYSKSLERHLYTSTGETDFTNVTSLRGVFITSILAESKY